MSIVSILIVCCASCVVQPSPHSNPASTNPIRTNAPPRALEPAAYSPQSAPPVTTAAPPQSASVALTQNIATLFSKTPSVPVQERNVRTKVQLTHRSATGAVSDLEARHVFVFGFNKSWLINANNKTIAVLPESAYFASFSPQGRFVGVVGNTSFVVLDTTNGALLRRFTYARGTIGSPQTKTIRVNDQGRVRYFDGCQMLEANATNTQTPKAVGSRLCGRPLVSQDNANWFLWQQEFGEDDPTANVYQLDWNAKANNPPKRIFAVGEIGLSQLLVAPNGKHLCYFRRRTPGLYCRDTQGNEAVVWQQGTDKRFVFALDGRLAFGVGKRHKERKLMLADLNQGTVQGIGTLGPKEEWLFAVGTSSIAANGGSRVLLFTPNAGTQTNVVVGLGEWEGFAAIPGTDQEFFVGKERRASRDFYRVSLK